MHTEPTNNLRSWFFNYCSVLSKPTNIDHNGPVIMKSWFQYWNAQQSISSNHCIFLSIWFFDQNTAY